jgi:hypothetical protein
MAQFFIIVIDKGHKKMENLHNTEIGAAFNEAQIECKITTERQNEPDFECFDDDFIEKHGKEWATIADFNLIKPLFINVRVKDYAKAIEIMIVLDEESEVTA